LDRSYYMLDPQGTSGVLTIYKRDAVEVVRRLAA
jgi:hypothetical protein